MISTQALEDSGAHYRWLRDAAWRAYLAPFCQHTSKQQRATWAIDLHSCLISSVSRYVLAAATTFAEQPICETNAGEHLCCVLCSQHEIRPWHRTDPKHLT